MPSSKLFKHFSILKALVLGPQKIGSIAYLTKMECTSLKPYLDFLVSNNLVEEIRGSGKRSVYAINERGVSVFETLRALKYLKKLQIPLSVVEETRK